MRPTVTVVALAALAAPAICASHVLAQEDVPIDARVEDGPSERPTAGISFDVYGGTEHRFETDIDGGGQFDLTRFGFGLGWSTDPKAKTGLSIRGGLLYEGYDFTSPTGLIGAGPALDREPWEDIWTGRVALILRHSFNKEWTIYGGPVVRFSGETDSSFEDSLDWGGFGGVIWKPNDTLRLGFGAGAATRIEDSVRIFPVFTIDWKINDLWSLTTDSGARRGVGGFSFSGVELVYKINDQWQAGLGGTWEFRRFRLDRDGIAPGGVGQDENFPLWLRLTWRPAPEISFNLWGGAAFAGNLRLENENGDRISDQDYDAPLLLGFSAQVRF